MTRHITVNTVEQAWRKVSELFPTDFQKDESCSINAGYPIYRSTAAGHDEFICDLNARLEINLSATDTINVWIKEDDSMEVMKNTRALHKELARIMSKETLRGMCNDLFEKSSKIRPSVDEERFKKWCIIWAIYDNEWCNRYDEEY